MKPEWFAATFLCGWVAAAAVRGTLTEPGTWIAVILGVVVMYLVAAFMQGGSGSGTATRKERLTGMMVAHPWRVAAVAAAAMFAVWIVLSPLFDRAGTAAFWGLAFGSAAFVFVWGVGAGYLTRKQQR